MDFSFALLLINIHLVFDFIFQGKSIIELRFPQKYNKESIVKSIKGNLRHVLKHLFGSLIIVGVFCKLNGQGVPIIEIIAITVTHFIIDESKSILIMKKIFLQEDVWIFLMDQILHLLAIYLICFIGDFNSLMLIANYNLSYLDKILLIILIAIVTTFATGIFIKILMKSLENNPYKKLIKKNVYLPSEKKNLSGARNGGFIIGILERSFILIIMIINQPSMIGFVLATKSIARFKKLEDESFAEYFIIGSFTSFIIAILGGYLISNLLKSIT
ncbi:DUF3307 domain-containing protein [Clostridium sp. UBA1652]|uniref:DUF3307 domain-containing protein n=1 Tax=Clostridium sp. UBA1652 TaxID=1946348 RepID=UPI00257B9AA8|nr:DUF3307 domain-containing protein [Clostridium sp. UBA1652]